MQLEIQTLLRLHGIDHVKEYLKLEVKQKGDLFLFKYNQIEADWTKTALYDCRGIILDSSDGWKVVAFPYRKFFNLEEGYCAKIDWSNAVVFDKADGSLITMWYYKGEWRMSTSGTIDADGYANSKDYSFANLVGMAATKMYGSYNNFLSKLDPDYNYMFELCTPLNIVVKQHDSYQLVLHGARHMPSLREVDIDDIDLVKVKKHSLNNEADIRATFTDMTWQDEGYIVMDKNFNRAKIKNPAYVAAHHISTGKSPYHILQVVKNNELSEFLVYFPSRKDELYDLQDRYNELVKRLTDIYVFNLKHLDCSAKEYAKHVFEICNKPNMKHFSGLFFMLRQNKTTVRDYVNNMSDRDLFNILKISDNG